MQHSARDPLRDHAHGRIYRITYPSRPLVQPAKIAGASIEQLLENLKLPEYRTRYRSRRELRGRSAKQVTAAVKRWTSALNPRDPNYERFLLEGLDHLERQPNRHLPPPPTARRRLLQSPRRRCARLALQLARL